MSFHSEVKRRSAVANSDLSAGLFHVVDLVANSDHKVDYPAAGGGYGILLNKPRSGEDASVAVEGQSEVRVGGAVQAGDLLTSAATGWATKVTSGAACVIVGRVITGAASGMIAAVELKFTRVSTG